MSDKRSALPFLLAIVVFGGLAFFLGHYSGSFKTASTCDEPTSCEVPEDYFGSSPDLSHERNLVWQAMNERPETMPETREGRLGIVLAYILDPASNEARVNVALNLWMVKGLAHLDPQEVQLVLLSIQKGDAPERLRAFKEVSSGDELAGALINSVLRDEKRLELFMSGEKIPYENDRSSEAQEIPQDAGEGMPASVEPPEEAGYHQELQEELEKQDE